MKRRDMLKVTGAAVFAPPHLSLALGAAAEKKPQRILYFTRNVGFYHSVVQRKGAAAEPLGTHPGRTGQEAGIDVVCSKDGRVFDGDLSHSTRSPSTPTAT